MAINVRQTFDPTGTVYPNYLQQQYMSRTILPPPGSSAAAAATTPPPAAQSGGQSGGQNDNITTYTDPNGSEYYNYNPATGQGTPAPARVYGQTVGQVVGRDAKGNPIVVSGQRFNNGNVLQNQQLTGNAARVAYDASNPNQPQINQGTLDMSMGARRASAATQGAQDALMASPQNGGQGRQPQFYSDGAAIFGDGGIIPEPVVGRGLYSGKPYIFGEKGPEGVIPNDQMPEHMQEQGGHGAYADGGTIGFRPQNGPTPSPQQGPAPITPMANPNAASRVARAVRGRSRNPYDPYLNRQFLDEGRSAMHNPVQFSVNGRNYTTFTDAAGQRHVRDEASGHTVPLGVISDMGIQDGGVSDGGVVADSSVIGDSTVADSGGPTVNDLMSGFNSPSQFDQQNPQPAPAPAPTPTYTAPTPTVAPTTTTSGTTDTSGGNTLTAGTTDTTTSTPPPDTTTTAGIMDPTPVSATDVTVGGATGGGNLAYPYDPFAAALINNQDSSGGTTLNPDDLQNLLSQ